MRAICKICNNKNNCSYLKHNKEGDCIDVQTSDYGYQEAVEKACDWLKNNIDKYLYNRGGFEEYIPTCGDKLYTDLEKAMEL